jgi:hypothetical protein
LDRKIYQFTYESSHSIFAVRGNGIYRIDSFDDLELHTRYSGGSATEI